MAHVLASCSQGLLFFTWSFVAKDKIKVRKGVEYLLSHVKALCLGTEFNGRVSLLNIEKRLLIYVHWTCQSPVSHAHPLEQRYTILVTQTLETLFRNPRALTMQHPPPPPPPPPQIFPLDLDFFNPPGIWGEGGPILSFLKI